MVGMDPISDTDPIAGIAAGSPNWTVVYARCRRPMIGTAITVFGSADTARGGRSAEDVVQDVMAATMAKGALPASITSLEKLQSYLCVAVFRRALNAKTREAGTMAQLPEDIDPDDSVDDEFTMVEYAIVAARAAELVDLLPEEQRTVFREHVLRGRTQQEVAQELGVSESMIRKHRDSGLRRLRSMLDIAINENTNRMEAK